MALIVEIIDMRKILLIGAGRSASSLIKYLLENAQQQNWFITIAEKNTELAKAKIKDSQQAKVVEFDVNNEIQRLELISDSDLVISMLPASM
ncbi:MAG TPA: saccharopine dehydrogenase, partial [Flavobacteriales bacterium]|nr:saccharopine dehydrogenase [Flavobacteriales bacterium]